MQFKEQDSGMKLSKIRFLSYLISVASIGLFLGIFICLRSSITFNTEIDVSSLIGIFGLIVTIFVMPFIIESKKDKAAGIKAMANVDLDMLCAYVDNLREIYKKLLSKQGQALSTPDYTKSLSIFKQMSSLLTTLSIEFVRRDILLDFGADIYEALFEDTYEDCTKWLKKGHAIETSYVRKSLIRLDQLFNELKKYRYKLYE